MDRITTFSLGLFVVYFAIHWEVGTSRVLFSPSVVNCTIYNATLPCFTGDRNVFCLTNGTSVKGICEAQEAVCSENATLTTCPQQTVMMSTVATTTPDSNTACQLTATWACYFYALCLVTSALWGGLSHRLEL